VFLPGWEEINTVQQLIEATLPARDLAGCYIIHALHSQLPTLTQACPPTPPPPPSRPPDMPCWMHR
jgi:HrpA-like RNA helicase